MRKRKSEAKQIGNNKLIWTESEQRCSLSPAVTKTYRTVILASVIMTVADVENG